MEYQFTYTSLLEFTQNIFLKMGCPDADAKLAARALLSADLRGIDSHGVARLSGYTRLWEVKRINSKPSVKVVHETPSTAVVDGDSGLGLVVAPFAMQVAIDKAKNAGSGWVSVRNSNHFGIAGFHAMMALEHDMIGMAMTNASALVAPTFSVERMLVLIQFVLPFLQETNQHLLRTLQLQQLLTASLKSSKEKMNLLQQVGSRIRLDKFQLMRTN